MTSLVIAHPSELRRPLLQASVMGGAGLQAFYRRVSAYTFCGLGFKQSSFHRVARVSRNQPYNAFGQ